MNQQNSSMSTEQIFWMNKSERLIMILWRNHTRRGSEICAFTSYHVIRQIHKLPRECWKRKMMPLIWNESIAMWIFEKEVGIRCTQLFFLHLHIYISRSNWWIIVHYGIKDDPMTINYTHNFVTLASVVPEVKLAERVADICQCRDNLVP